MIAPLAHRAAHYGIRLNDSQIVQFDRYLALLRDWRSRANLVSDDEPETIVRRHFLESLALGAALRERELLRPGAHVVDVGAGAGFPGMPIKLAWPAIALTLVEATSRKTAFLDALVRELAIDDVTVRNDRAETLAHDSGLRERFDLVLARAVAPLPALLELTLPFARVGGRVVTVKGSRTEDEVARAANALDVLGGRAFVVPFAVPGPPQHIVAVVKLKATPERFPRRPGVPVKSPL